MKKLICVLFAAVLGICAVFAADSYSVKSVTGKVTYEAAPGEWKNVTAGQKLSSSAVINTSLDAVLVLSGDTGDVTIKAMQKGTIQSLTASAAGGKSLKKNKGLKKNSIAGASTSNSKGVSTASTRSTNLKEDQPWDD